MKQRKFGMAILLGMIAGIVVGYICHQSAVTPAAAKEMASYFSLATDIFLRLIKMIIAPLVFSGLVVGLAGMSDVKAVGRVGVRSLGWFFCASITSLLLGMALSNLFQLGHAMNLPLPAAGTQVDVNTTSFNLRAFVSHIVPTSIFQAMAQNEILPILVFSLFFGTAMGAIRDKLPGAVLGAIEELFAIMLRVTTYVMRVAPVGVFAALAAVITVQGVDVLWTYGKFIGAVYFGMALLCTLLVVAGYLVLGRDVFPLLKLMREPMMIAFCTSSSEATYPKTIEQLTKFGVKTRISTFVLPLAYSFNLDGSMMFQAFASLFVAQAFNVHLSWEQQLSMLFVMLLTSKGIAGVPRASMVVVAATLPLFGLPIEGMVLLLAVDQFIDMGRTTTNVVGNSIAAAVIAKWEGALAPWTGAPRSAEFEIVGTEVDRPATT
ncbi:dicarboxylate/amino acid:cation symporter [Ralstonia solanacearum]|uniref:dicarboxylate/amino acid:cation symporter n=1 Tax=Ralstonia solanacearum TaxID=305 RepID=UPI0006DC4F28|nr:dicarboxylate/amino acid:cation symporter [Ralstonia solanacearum]